MEFEKEMKENVLVIKPKEKNIDVVNALDFKTQIINLHKQENVKMLLDLSNIFFIDSTGLSAIISIFKSFEKKEDFLMCSINQPVSLVFNCTGMNKIFNIYENQEIALRQCSTSR
jgi:anti-sigma B factor antagonist